MPSYLILDTGKKVIITQICTITKKDLIIRIEQNYFTNFISSSIFIFDNDKDELTKSISSNRGLINDELQNQNKLNNRKSFQNEIEINDLRRKRMDLPADSVAGNFSKGPVQLLPVRP